MKKAWVLIMVICIFGSCASSKALDYPQPEFNNASVFVIDTFKEKGSFEDYIKLHNNSTSSNIKFRVYFHKPGSNEWMLYGIGELKGSGDTDTIDTDIKNIDKYRYFAIEPMDGKKYKYQFYKGSNDLHINILDN